MTTKLDRPLKREVMIEGAPYVLTIAPDGLKLVQKGKRKGYELDWKSFISGEAALATAMSAMLSKAPEPVVATTPSKKAKKRTRRQ